MGRIKKLNPIIIYLSGKPFDKAVCNQEENVKDYWFIWHEDYEPIRLNYQNEIISSTLHREHWTHKINKYPYLDNNRIEVFFLPYFHTPKIRLSEEDVLFYIAVNSYLQPQKIEKYEVIENELIPPYYTNKGLKKEHFPPTDYEGWPDLHEVAPHQGILDSIKKILRGLISWLKESLIPSHA